MRIAEVMSTSLVTVGAETPLKAAAHAMLEAGVSGLPVVDDDDRLVGIITEADFVAQEAAKDVPRPRRLLDALFGNGGAGQLSDAEKVGDIMSTDITTVRSDYPVSRAAQEMVDVEVKRLPVVDEEGTLVGIVSRADVVRAFARSDDGVSAEIEEMLHRRILPVDSSAVQVVVEDGVVTLSGKVEARGDATIVEQLIERMDGVVRVVNRLEWDVDDDQSPHWAGYSREGVEE